MEDLAGQTVVVIGGSAGIGLETARRARAEGAEVILAARNTGRLEQAAREVGATRTGAFDANDTAALARFFRDLPTIDHVMVTGPGPHYRPVLEMDAAEVREALSGHAVLDLEIARNAVGKMRPGGTLVFMGGTGGRRVDQGVGALVAAATAALPAFTAALAVELAPVRANLIAAGFVDTPLSASLLGDQLEERRNELRTKLPIGRVVGPADVAALAIHIMSNTALTGATFDIDGGQQFVR
jgi:NAD(P)-dependent dehydrogenase (short-subunit alcohol dehydrogenase family)